MQHPIFIARTIDGWCILVNDRAAVSIDGNTPHDRRAAALAAVNYAVSLGGQIEIADTPAAVSMRYHVEQAARLLDMDIEVAA